jgi:ligand-binding sensor domain-containing protein
MYVDHQDRLWAGSFNNGVRIFNNESLTDPDSLNTLGSLSVSSVMQDHEDGMWISTLDQGVFYFPNLTVQNYTLPSSRRISALAFADREVFLGNYGGEVFSMTEKGSVKRIHQGIGAISCLFRDNDQRLWVSDGSGTHILHPDGRLQGPEGQPIYKVLIQVDDYIIGCSSMGFVKMLSN